MDYLLVYCLLITRRPGDNDLTHHDCITGEYLRSLTIPENTTMNCMPLYHEVGNVMSISSLIPLDQVTVTKKDCAQSIIKMSQSPMVKSI